MEVLDRARSRIAQPWRTIVDWALTIIAAMAFVLATEAEVAKPYRIPSASMEPTLHCAKPQAGCDASFSDRVVALRFAYRVSSPKRGQVVVFKAPTAAGLCGEGSGGSTFVKRLIGLPGETVSERRGHVYVDGKPLAEPYVTEANRDRESGTWRVPSGRYFFLGDNRADSCDSRRWGSVPRGDLIGPVVLTYWPPTHLSSLP